MQFIWRTFPRSPLALITASKGLHMVSAVHLYYSVAGAAEIPASKGLHMVSAVHRATPGCALYVESLLQRGCTWLVQFIVMSETDEIQCQQASKGLHMVSAVHRIVPQHRHENIFASKGLHMVSAVHPSPTTALPDSFSRLQRGCTWLVQFITRTVSRRAGFSP